MRSDYRLWTGGQLAMAWGGYLLLGAAFRVVLTEFGVNDLAWLVWLFLLGRATLMTWRWFGFAAERAAVHDARREAARRDLGV